MRHQTIKMASAVLCACASVPGIAGAATITGWNTSNVTIADNPPDYETGYSLVHAGDPATAPSTGQIAFTPPEATSPGIKVVNGEFTLGGPNPKPTTSGCIMASSESTCDGAFQSGKRFKEHMTSTDPIDLVFDVDPTGTQVVGSIGYQVYQRVVNKTGGALSGVKVELGFGLGDAFTLSTAGDGLGFAADFPAQPGRDFPVTSQFPFGLFGDAASNPNFTLDGFFAPERAGYEMAFSEDSISTGMFFGPYEDLFGSWMSEETLPEGAFWDTDGDPTTDALLMAWLTPSGKWEVRRDIDAEGAPETIAPLTFATLGEVDDYLGIATVTGLIDDLANLNLNYGIALWDAVGFDQFTMRVTAVPCTIPSVATASAFSLVSAAHADPVLGEDFCVLPPVAPVPLPAGLPLIVAALATLGWSARRRRPLAA